MELFKDRTVLVFEIDPEPLGLRVDIREHCIGDRRSAAKSWEGAGGEEQLATGNPAAFAVPAPGTYGDAPRNVARGSGLWQADLGITKPILITEKVHLDVRAEAFNIFNRGQYGTPQTNFSALSSFGAILATVNTGPVGTGTPRQIQFMMRLGF
jgi:hypothetical protein